MDELARVRSFNRTVVSRIGALNEGYLGRKRSLAACRVLFEVGADGLEIRALRERLGLDSGYTSRLLRSLEAEQLIAIAKMKADRRARVVRLTAAGCRELAVLNRLSDSAAAQLLEPLSSEQREALMTAMAAVENLLLAGAVRITVESATGPAASRCLSQYFRELETRFEDGFDAAYGFSQVAETLTPPAGYFLVASLNGLAIGCGGLWCHADHGEIKRMWVAPEHRRLGVGRRILQHIEALARERGLPLIRLSTNKSLTQAQSMYRRCGYHEVRAFDAERYAHHWFEKKL
jgi:DNA-binding MarR family transcriptional regulator/GNAT superfamily N-acetyltransferase